jgi:arylsulfatase A-like enzyme
MSRPAACMFSVAFGLMGIGVLTSHGAQAPSATSRPSKPNILWIGVDELRFDTPGCNGNTICRTPSIDRLASEGVRFTNAYTTCCLCTPARASMLTGLFAFKHGMGTNCDLYHALARELPNPDMLLHYRLQKAGYRCGFVGKWHMGAKKGPADYGFEGMSLGGYGDITNYEGFRSYLQKAGLSYGPVEDPIYGNPNSKTLLAGRWDGPVESTPAHYLAEYTIDMLNRFASNGRPFFIDCQFWGPHAPHLPSREFAGRHDRQAIQPWVNFKDDMAGKPASVRRFRSDFYRALPADWNGWREIVGLYYDYTSMIDQQIGRILARLGELGLADNTIVVFEADHGDMAGSHGLFDKGYMYQEAFRIPMIVRWPRVFRGGRACDEMVYNMDIFPTLLDVLGMPDEKLDGKSFLAALQGKPMPNARDAIYLEFHGIRYLYSQRALVTKDGSKYIFNAGDFDEVYDLRKDPGELVNRLDVPEDRETVAKLRERIKLAAAQAGDPIRDDIAKMFGDWQNLSGQFEAAGAIVPPKSK